MSHKILIIIGGSFLGAVLSLISMFIERSVIDFTGRNGFGMGFTAVVYIIIPAYFFILALILSLIAVHINSLPMMLAVSFFFSLLVSWKSFNSAWEIYNRPDYFDKTYFYSDIFQICAAFIIFPLIGVFIWYLKAKFSNAVQIP
jgi:hypothetical protein